jgi:hypothetical protein
MRDCGYNAMGGWNMKTLQTYGMTVLAAAVFANGCAAFRISIDEKDPATASSLTAKYDQRDLLTWGDLMAKRIISHPFPGPDQKNKAIVQLGIENRTRTHIDTKALEDTIITKLLDTQQMKIIDGSLRDKLLKEQNYQLANCDAATKVKIGKQLGARYMLTGSITEIGAESGREVRVSKKEDVFYLLTVEITDLETGTLELRKQEQRLRRASTPIIGW